MSESTSTTVVPEDDTDVTEVEEFDIDIEDDTDLVEDEGDEDTDEDDSPVEGDVIDTDGKTLVEAKGKRETQREAKAKAKEEAEKPLVTKRQAEALTKRFVDSLGKSIDVYQEILDKRAWKAMGYGSVQEYLDEQLGDLRLRLGRPQRLELLAHPELVKMSSREAAKVLGVDQSTIAYDRRLMKGEDEEGDEATEGEEATERKASSGGRKINWPNRAANAAKAVQASVEKLAEAVNALAVSDDLDDDFVAFREEWQGELGGMRAMLDATIGQLSGE